MDRFALLFPGQGSQYVGMGESFFSDDQGRKITEAAERALGFSLSRIMREGPIEALTATQVAQPAILLHSWLVFSKQNITASAVLGHSLGEYSALVACGVMDFIDAIKAVHIRGTLMQAAVPPGQGAMAAVIGLDAAVIKRVLEPLNNEQSHDYVACANFNGPAQTVIAGTKSGIDKAVELLKQADAKRVLLLEVSAPFHCALMKPVQHEMAKVLDKIPFNKPRIPFISNVSAQVESDPERIKSLLIDQIVSPIRFTECVAEILRVLPSPKFIELGPKTVLSGIVRKIDRTLEVQSIDSLGSSTQLEHHE